MMRVLSKVAGKLPTAFLETWRVGAISTISTARLSPYPNSWDRLRLILLGPLRGWAISPDAIVHVLADLEPRENPTVVEFGSGESTIILASALARKRVDACIRSSMTEAFWIRPKSGLKQRDLTSGLSFTTPL